MSDEIICAYGGREFTADQVLRHVIALAARIKQADDHFEISDAVELADMIHFLYQMGINGLIMGFNPPDKKMFEIKSFASNGKCLQLSGEFDRD